MGSSHLKKTARRRDLNSPSSRQWSYLTNVVESTKRGVAFVKDDNDVISASGMLETIDEAVCRGDPFKHRKPFVKDPADLRLHLRILAEEEGYPPAHDVVHDGIELQ